MPWPCMGCKMFTVSFGMHMFLIPTPADSSVTLAPRKVPSYLWGPVCPPLPLLRGLEDRDGPDSHCDWLTSGSRYGTCSRAPSRCFASEHWDTFLESFWTPHQQLACFLWPWPGWAHFLTCCAFGAHLGCAEMKLCFLFVGGHVTRLVGSLFPD